MELRIGRSKVARFSVKLHTERVARFLRFPLLAQCTNRPEWAALRPRSGRVPLELARGGRLDYVDRPWRVAALVLVLPHEGASPRRRKNTCIYIPDTSNAHPTTGRTKTNAATRQGRSP